VKIASPTFFALRDSRTPAIASLIAVVTNIAMNMMLIRILGYRGLALGTAISAGLNALLLLWLLRARLDGLEGRRNLRAMLSITAASMVMGIAVWLVDAWLERLMPGGSTITKAIRVLLAIGTGLGVLALAARALHIDEFNEALRLVSRKLLPAS
jgi:putative peptidoglycan lipid II flippase